MARKLRLQYPGALYHVINRGNYRGEIFETDGAKAAFVSCLGEASVAAGWRVHAYVVMRNHYHVALETPKGNLVDGMQWLQSTYATRFNRLRKERGHVFQGRYQSILVEDGAHLGAVVHYIHLNPVRSQIVPAEAAASYPWSSLALLGKPKARPAWLSFNDALRSAGELPDNAAGHRAYLKYLAWLAADEAAQKAFAFDRMCRGWVLGSQEFKLGLIEEHQQTLAELNSGETEVAEIRGEAWAQALTSCLRRLKRTKEDAAAAPKSAAWKVAIAVHLRANSTVKNPWLAEQLRMGDPDGVSRYVSETKQGKRPAAAALLRQITDIRV
jgi:putative transposase